MDDHPYQLDYAHQVPTFERVGLNNWGEYDTRVHSTNFLLNGKPYAGPFHMVRNSPIDKHGLVKYRTGIHETVASEPLQNVVKGVPIPMDEDESFMDRQPTKPLTWDNTFFTQPYAEDLTAPNSQGMVLRRTAFNSTVDRHLMPSSSIKTGYAKPRPGEFMSYVPARDKFITRQEQDRLDQQEAEKVAAEALAKVRQANPHAPEVPHPLPFANPEQEMLILTPEERAVERAYWTKVEDSILHAVGIIKRLYARQQYTELYGRLDNIVAHFNGEVVKYFGVVRPDEFEIKVDDCYDTAMVMLRPIRMEYFKRREHEPHKKAAVHAGVKGYLLQGIRQSLDPQPAPPPVSQPAPQNTPPQAPNPATVPPAAPPRSIAAPHTPYTAPRQSQAGPSSAAAYSPMVPSLLDLEKTQWTDNAAQIREIFAKFNQRQSNEAMAAVLQRYPGAGEEAFKRWRKNYNNPKRRAQADRILLSN